MCLAIKNLQNGKPRQQNLELVTIWRLFHLGNADGYLFNDSNAGPRFPPKSRFLYNENKLLRIAQTADIRIRTAQIAILYSYAVEIVLSLPTPSRMS